MYVMKFVTNLHRGRINCCPMRCKWDQMSFVCVKFALVKTMTSNHQYKTFLYIRTLQHLSFSVWAILWAKYLITRLRSRKFVTASMSHTGYTYSEEHILGYTYHTFQILFSQRETFLKTNIMSCFPLSLLKWKLFLVLWNTVETSYT